MSAWSCGCDVEAKHRCSAYPRCVGRTVEIGREQIEQHTALEELKATGLTGPSGALWRKQRPLFSGVLSYFPDALLEVAHVSFVGNEQHNAGQPLHWAREKSTDQLDAAARHLLNHATDPYDTDGTLHLAKAAWRILAELQLLKERA